MALKLSNCKHSNKIELNHQNQNFLIKNKSQIFFDYFNGNNGELLDDDSSQYNNFILPPCIVNGMAVSKTFPINYKNEEIIINDVVSYRINICLDIMNCIKQIQNTNILLDVELWYSNQDILLNQYDSIFCVSTRQLRIHFDLCRGIHYFLPAIFDYFHLSAVTLSIHGSLITLCQPYICKNEFTNNWLSNFIKNEHKNEKKFSSSMLETTEKKPNNLMLQIRRLQLVQCKLISVILLSLFNLKKVMDEFYRILPPWQQAKINYEALFVDVVYDNFTPLTKQIFNEIKNNFNENTMDNKDPTSMVMKFQENNFSEFVKTDTIVEEKNFDDILNSVEHDVSYLCGVTIEQWQRFLLFIMNSNRINQHLAKIHHLQRIKRFSEAFFYIENPLSSLNSLCDQNSNLFLELSDSLRKSSYFINLPPCDVECVHLDGDSNTLPIIFEEKYGNMKKLDEIKTINPQTGSSSIISSPSKQSLSSSSSSNSPKSSIHSFFSKLNSISLEKTTRKDHSSQAQVQKFKNCSNSEINTFELFELYKLELFNEKSNENFEQMNRRIKILNAFFNRKNMLKNYSPLNINYSRRSFKNIQSKHCRELTEINKPKKNKECNSWPNLSPNTTSLNDTDDHTDNNDNNNNLLTICSEKEIIKSKCNQKQSFNNGKNRKLKYSSKNSNLNPLLNTMPIINYKNYAGTMYFPKPPKEFTMEEVDEPAHEVCLKPIPTSDDNTEQNNDEDCSLKIDTLKPKSGVNILIEEINFDELSIDKNKNVSVNNKINNSLSFQDLTKINEQLNVNKFELKKNWNKMANSSKDDICLKSNLNNTKFTFVELLQSDHCLICCGSIEKRKNELWPCKCAKNQLKQSNTPESTPTLFRRVSALDTELISFLQEKESFRVTLINKFKNLSFYSDTDSSLFASRVPYFQCETDFKAFK